MAEEVVPALRRKLVRYRFVVPQYVTSYGQSLRVVGSLGELGGWNPAVAPCMSWSEGHEWSLECTLPQETFQFKVVVFEGQGIRWEGGSNRVVQAEGEDGDVPVEIVVWLTCHFDVTASTQLQLAVPRASVQDAYETSKATLEFLRRRRTKLGQDADQAPSTTERSRQATELARLSAAVAEQSSTVESLGDILGEMPQGKTAGRPLANNNGNGVHSGAGFGGESDADDEVLLLAIDSVALPRALRRISFSNVVQAWNTGPSMLSSANAASEEGAPAAPSPSPFLRGELDSRAEEVISAAGALLQEMQAPSSEAHTATGSSPSPAFSGEEWAILAEEASQVAVAMEALGGDEEAAHTSHAQLLQLQCLVSVGSVLAERGAAAAAAGAEVNVVAVDEVNEAARMLLGCLDGGIDVPAEDCGAHMDTAVMDTAVMGTAMESLGEQQKHEPAAALAAAGGIVTSDHTARANPEAAAHTADMSGRLMDGAADHANAFGANPRSSPPSSQPSILEDLPPWQRMAASLKARLAPAPLPASRKAAASRQGSAAARHAAVTPPVDPLMALPSAAGESEGSHAQTSPSASQGHQAEEDKPRHTPPKFNLRGFLDGLFL